MDKQFTYELTIKAKQERRDEAVKSLGVIVDELGAALDIPSHDDSYQFQDIKISNEMFFNDATSDGFIYFKAHFQPTLTIF